MRDRKWKMFNWNYEILSFSSFVNHEKDLPIKQRSERWIKRENNLSRVKQSIYYVLNFLVICNVLTWRQNILRKLSLEVSRWAVVCHDVHTVVASCLGNAHLGGAFPDHLQWQISIGKLGGPKNIFELISVSFKNNNQATSLWVRIGVRWAQTGLGQWM